MKGLGYGQGYQYAHNLESKVADMQCLPDNLKDRIYYHPTEEGIEKRIKARLEEIRNRKLRNSQGIGVILPRSSSEKPEIVPAPASPPPDCRKRDHCS